MTASVPERRNWARASVKYQQASARGLRDACSTLAVLCGSDRGFFFLMEKRRGARVSGRKKTTKKWRQGRVAIVEVVEAGLAMSLFRLSNQLLPLQSSRRLICLCKLATGEASFCLCFDGEALLPVVAIDDMQFRSARRASRIGSRVLLLLLSLRVSALKLMAFLT